VRTFCRQGRFVGKDILWEGCFVTFCRRGHFVCMDVLKAGRFVGEDVWKVGRFVAGCFVEGRQPLILLVFAFDLK
jgi:hypothetical protein